MTLIELLLAVAIVAILSTIAYPSFQDYLVRSHRHVALADMLRMQLVIEQNYDGATGTFDWSAVYDGSDCLICDSDPKRFQFTVAKESESDGAPYRISAVAQNDLSQHTDACFSSSDSPSNTIWINAINKRAPTACWQ
ncbi:type IV pilin protein [Vibrio agarilyticus]|nr:type IV pilin protein [Vibrio agarilyticus]